MITQYNYTDAGPSSTTNYYRIKAVGKNGEFNLTSIVRIQLNVAVAMVAVYPNPLQSNRFTVEFNHLDKGTYKVNIYNNDGQQIFEKAVEHPGGSATQTIQLPQVFSPGLYELRISNKHLQFTKSLLAK